MRGVFFWLLVTILAAFSGPATAVADETVVRVRIAQAPDVVLKGDLRYRGAAQGRGDTLNVTTRSGELRINGRRASGTVEVTADKGSIEVNGTRYRGSMRLSATGGAVRVINLVALDDYLASVLGAEMSHTWPIEALKAQAVVSRSFVAARSHRDRAREYDVDATVLSQVYVGIRGEHITTRLAVSDTAGMVLSHGGRVIEAFFHSSCGGHTEDPASLWGNSLPYIQPVEDPYCQAAPNYFWSLPVEHRELGRQLGLPPVVEVKIHARAPGGRVLRAEFLSENDSKTFTGEEVRQRLGYNKLRSTLFHVSTRGTTFVFNGSGGGHGVGMCQWGARGMAEKDKSFRDIVAHYFPRAELTRL